jgi:hypothetical protein
MADLVLLEEVAEPSFLLMINKTEAVYNNLAEATKLQEYGPMAMYLINCLQSVMDVTPEQSLNLMLMTCIQQRMKEMHEREARSVASIVINMKITSSEFLADVVQQGLSRGALQVKIKDLRLAMEAAGRTTRSQVHDQEYSAESVRSALTGMDTFGLGGGSFGRDFMRKLCTLHGGGVKPLEERLQRAGAI